LIQDQSGSGERTEAQVETPFRAKNIRRGAIYFMILTVVGLAVLFFITRTPQTLEALRHLDARFISIAIVLSVVDMGLSTWRYHILVRKIKPGVTPWLCLRANLANIFMGAVTPSQTGGGPAQLYIFYRAGISLANGVFVGVVNFTFSLGLLLVAASFSLIVIREHFSQGMIHYLLQYGFLAFAGLFVFFFLALWRPDLLSRAVNALAKLMARVHQSWGKRILRLRGRVIVELDNYRASCTHFFRNEPWLLLSAFGLTILLYLNKFTLAYFLMRGLGVTGDYLHMIAIQTLILFVLFFAPTPGASGIAELSIAALMSSLMPNYLLPIFTLLHRFFLIYLPAAFGSYIVLAELRSQTRSRIRERSYDTLAE
jgi:uncharacterized protein (TIRG00374 family)